MEYSHTINFISLRLGPSHPWPLSTYILLLILIFVSSLHLYLFWVVGGVNLIPNLTSMTKLVINIHIYIVSKTMWSWYYHIYIHTYTHTYIHTYIYILIYICLQDNVEFILNAALMVPTNKYFGVHSTLIIDLSYLKSLGMLHSTYICFTCLLTILCHVLYPSSLMLSPLGVFHFFSISTHKTRC